MSRGARFEANQRDEVVGNGDPVTLRSRFNFNGFRYVRVIGIESVPAVSDATDYESLTLGGYVVHCPTRERLGYGGVQGKRLRWPEVWTIIQQCMLVMAETVI